MSKSEFKIDDLYAMPDWKVFEWYDAPDAVIAHVFQMNRLDIDTARLGHDSEKDEEDTEEDVIDGRIRVHLKMESRLYHTIGIYVLSLDRKPYGVFISALVNDFLITDEHLHRSAIAFAELYRKRPLNGRIVDGSFDLSNGVNLDVAKNVHGVVFQRGAIVKTRDGFRLVDARLADRDGTLLFDEHMFITMNHNLNWVLSEGAKLVADAIPHGVRHFVVNESQKRGASGKLFWVAVVAGTDEGTYAIGFYRGFDNEIFETEAEAFEEICQDQGLRAWGRHVLAERIGDPELFDDLEAFYGIHSAEPMP